MSKTWNKEKQKYEYSPTFTLELRLMTTPEDDAVLDKRFGICNHIYNVMVKEARKRLSNLYRDHEYKEIMYPYCRTGKFKTGDKKKLAALREKYGLTEYSFHKYVDAEQTKFKDNIDCDVRQKEASKVWKAVKDVLYSNGELVHFRKRKDKHSLEAKKNAAGIRYSNQRLHWKGLDIPVVVRKRDTYAKEALRTCFVKYCRIVRKWHKHKYRYYVQLVMEGVPPIKENRQKNYDDILHDDTPVGIDIGPSTIAVVSPDKVLFQELAADVSSIEKEIRHLNRKIERETRLANPDNYNTNGTWKTSNPNRTYNKSRHQLMNEHKRKELYQKRHNKLKYSHDCIANEILESFGTDIHIEQMDWQALAKRSKKTEKNDKGKYKKKKRFGKSISNHAPSMLVKTLRRKLSYVNKPLMVVDNKSIKASQFNHITGEYMSSDLKLRWKHLDDTTLVQRDLYSAFLLMNCTDAETISMEQCFDTFDDFKKKYDDCMTHLEMQKVIQNKKFPACMGVGTYILSV